MRFKEGEVRSRTSAATGLEVEAPLCTPPHARLETLSGSLEQNSFHARKRRAIPAFGSPPFHIITGRSTNPRFSSGCLWGPHNPSMLLQLWPSLSRSLTPRWVTRHWYTAQFYKPPAELSRARAPQELLHSWLRAELTERTENSSQQMSRQQFSLLYMQMQSYWGYIKTLLILLLPCYFLAQGFRNHTNVLWISILNTSHVLNRHYTTNSTDFFLSPSQLKGSLPSLLMLASNGLHHSCILLSTWKAWQDCTDH